jgi:hypothetical protein
LGSQGFDKEDGRDLRGLVFSGELFRVLSEAGFATPKDATRTYRRYWSNSPAGMFLYLWDEVELDAMLKGPSPLPCSDWGSDRTTGFVRWSIANKVVPLTPAFDAVADAYGDKTNAGRTDVLPGISRTLLLSAFRRINGFEDEMSAIYLRAVGMAS